MFPGKPVIRLFLPPLGGESPAEASMREELGFAAADAPRGHPRILFFGHLRPYKGVETLLEAFARLRPELRRL